ncbi:MAG: DUF1360 domain-containing protein [Actinomycetota bacterium]|nr:DUF1360 domain-containing protein [Actinomycetota bacterium]
MSTSTEQVRRVERAYAPNDQKPLGSYALLMAVFCTLAGVFAGWFRRSGRELPETIRTGDLLLLTLASHKASRLIAKDRVTSPIRAPFTRYQDSAGPGEVAEKPGGRGFRAVIGELLVCPYCLGMWISAALTAGLLVAPRSTRWLSAVLAIFFGADVLQIAYKKAEDTL